MCVCVCVCVCGGGGVQGQIREEGCVGADPERGRVVPRQIQGGGLFGGRSGGRVEQFAGNAV